MSISSICLFGFGEVGTTLAEDLLTRGRADLLAWDKGFELPGSKPAAAADRLGIPKAPSAGDAASANLVISAVTAAETLNAVESMQGGLKAETLVLDLNSASPGTKQAAAKQVNEAGAQYLEASIMSPIGPKRIESPILLGGPHAEAALADLHAIGFVGARAFSSEYGRASAAKMCRSVIVKGMEALVTEALVSARFHGVEQTVVQSLTDLFPGPDWSELSAYMIGRSIEHGKRRAEEMQEVARTVEEADLVPWMSDATVARQQWADQRLAEDLPITLEDLLDGLIETIGDQNKC